LAGGAFVILVLSIIVWGLMTRTAAGLAAACSPLSLMLPGAIVARRLGWAWPCAIFTPLMIPVLWYALLNSTFVTLRQGGIRWRETFYPLDTLRAANVQ